MGAHGRPWASLPKMGYRTDEATRVAPKMQYKPELSDCARFWSDTCYSDRLSMHSSNSRKNSIHNQTLDGTAMKTSKRYLGKALLVLFSLAGLLAFSGCVEVEPAAGGDPEPTLMTVEQAVCMQPWCHNIGSVAGDQCRIVYPGQCGGCDYACSFDGCLQPYCAGIGRIVGDMCRQHPYTEVCGRCPNRACAEDEPPPIPPEIVTTDSIQITTDSATIVVETDVPTRLSIEYGETTSYGDEEVSGTLQTVHIVVLTDLDEGTEYHFLVTALDAEGETTVGDDETFTTEVAFIPPVLTYGNDRLYQGPTLSGFPPGVFQTERTTIASARSGLGGGPVAHFLLEVIPDETGIPQTVIDRSYLPAQTVVAPSCGGGDWCDPVSRQSFLVGAEALLGGYVLRYTLTAENGARSEHEFHFEVVDLRAAIERILTVLGAYRDSGIVPQTGETRESSDQASLVFAHATAALAEEQWSTVLAALRAMHDVTLDVRDGIDPGSYRAAQQEIETLMTEVNTGVILSTTAQIEIRRAEPAVITRIEVGWDNRDVSLTDHNVINDAHFSLFRYEASQLTAANEVEGRVALGRAGFPEDARALVDTVISSVSELEAAIERQPDMLGLDEAAEVQALATDLGLAMDDYLGGSMGNEDIADFMVEIFGILDQLQQAQNNYLGLANAQYYIMLAIYSVVEQAINNAEGNVCSGASHVLIDEARRRWDYLANLLLQFRLTSVDTYLSDFVGAVLADHGMWESYGDPPADLDAAFPNVLCFIAAVYNSSYTQDADSRFYSDNRLVIEGCPATPVDWVPDCGL